MASGTGDNILKPLVVIVAIVSLLTIFGTAISSLTINHSDDNTKFYSSLGEYEPYKNSDGNYTGYQGLNYISSGGGVSQVYNGLGNKAFITLSTSNVMSFVAPDQEVGSGDAIHVFYIKGEYTGADGVTRSDGFLISKHWGLWSTGIAEVTNKEVVKFQSNEVYVSFTIPGENSYLLIINSNTGNMANDLKTGNITVNVGILSLSYVEGTDLIGTLIGLLTGNFFGNFLGLPVIIMAPLSAVIDIILAYIGLRLIGIISPL